MLDQQDPFICVTTQLIEAGVDVSFKCVIRSLAGLDSIAQAAGRCNRHGEDESQNVYIIDHAEEAVSKLKEIKVGKEMSSYILARFKKKADQYERNLLLPKAMSEYFRYYYNRMEVNLNYYVKKLDKEMTKLLMSLSQENDYVTHYQKKHGASFPLLLNGSYKTAAEHFQVIDQKTTSVLVPYGRGKELIAQLNSGAWLEDISKFLKQAQQYTVNLYSQELEHLRRG
ncbi:hypothetical protein HMSSN036_93080 [Paenibacillus macerans]|nr:hypothetical protein HMSSN036_93080 [Paenibacillus macerans]